MTEVNEYKCPCCGGRLEFNSTVQNMKCPYCDSEFPVETVENYNIELNNASGDEMSWDNSGSAEWDSAETANMKEYSCKSCGGTIIADDTAGASSCPYCGNPVVMAGVFSGALRPDRIIPFQFDREAAKQALKKHLEGKKLLPKVFKDENHIEEIKGLYVPVWLFSAEVDTNMCFRAEKKRRWSDANFNYVETSYYQAVRAGNISFAQVPVDGSSKMPDDLMESIEPFDFTKAVDFSTAFLSGYLADKYDVTREQSVGRANERIKTGAESAFRDTVTGYDTVHCESSSVKFRNAKSIYALYPVWILTTSWNNEKYTFAMNGQTGKFVGNLPVDKGAAVRLFAIIAAVVTAVCFVISLLLSN